MSRRFAFPKDYLLQGVYIINMKILKFVLFLMMVFVLNGFSQGTNRVSNLKVDGSIVFGTSTSKLTDISGSLTYAGAMLSQAPSPAIQLITETNVLYFVPTTNTPTARGSALTSALASAYSSTSVKKTILVPPGAFNMGQMSWNFTNLQFIGSGIDSTIISGRIVFAGSLCTFSDFTLTNNIALTDTFICGGYYTNRVDSFMRRMRIYGMGGVTHSMQLTGDGWTLDDVESNGGTNAHTFVLKGTRNVRITDCKAVNGLFNGLLIKSDASLGMNSNINVRGMVIENPTMSGIFLEAQVNTWISAVDISGVSLFRNKSAPSSYGIFLGNSSNNGTNNPIENVSISDSIFNTLDSQTVIGSDFYGTVTVQRCTFIGESRSGPQVINDSEISAKIILSDVVIQSNSGDQYKKIRERIVQKNNYRDVAYSHLQSYSTQFLSTGVLSNYVNWAYVTNSLLYFGTTLGYELGAAYLTSNDPVWISSGGNVAGVFKLALWGTSTNNNHPYPGAVSGCFYAAVSTTVTNSGTVKTSDIQPGKVLGRVLFSHGVYHKLTLKLKSSSQDSIGRPGYVENDSSWVIGASTVDYANSTYTQLIQAYIPFYPKAFLFNTTNLYLGVFGGGSGTGAWVPAYFDSPSLEIELRNSEQGATIKQETTLP